MIEHSPRGRCAGYQLLKLRVCPSDFITHKHRAFRWHWGGHLSSQVRLDCKAFTLEQEVNLKEDIGANMALVERQGKGMLRLLLPAGGGGYGRDGKSEGAKEVTSLNRRNCCKGSWEEPSNRVFFFFLMFQC